MMGKSHFTIGTISSITAVTATGCTLATEPVLFCISVWIGAMAALLPDIDAGGNALFRTKLGVGDSQTNKEMLRVERHIWKKKGNVFGKLIRWIVAMLWDVFMWLVARGFNVIAKVLPHRGPTHWIETWALLTVFVFCFVPFGLPVSIAAAFSAGYLSHLAADAMTITGIPSKILGRDIHLLPKSLRVSTGKWREGVYVFLIVVGWGMFYFYWRLDINLIDMFV